MPLQAVSKMPKNALKMPQFTNRQKACFVGMGQKGQNVSKLKNENAPRKRKRGEG